jgi:hypothetical protein
MNTKKFITMELRDTEFEDINWIKMIKIGSNVALNVTDNTFNYSSSNSDNVALPVTVISKKKTIKICEK